MNSPSHKSSQQSACPSAPVAGLVVLLGACGGLQLHTVKAVDVHTDRGLIKVDLESYYLPRVVACEHGGAATDAALEALAVAARTYAYYKVLIEKRALEDSEGDQVYSCNNPPTERVRRAVENTRGKILTHNGQLVAAFYVRGSRSSDPSCSPQPEQADWTEEHVTYNENKSGSAVAPSSLGHSQSPHNRGCLSQLGSDCLAQRNNYNYQKILRYYYGSDVTLVDA